MLLKLKNSVFFLLFSLFITATITALLFIKCNFLQAKDKKVSAENTITVVLDAGHGGEDGGAIGGKTVYEKELNLSIALKIGEKLSAKGINVAYTRTEDVLLYDRNVDYTNRKKALDLAARVKFAQSVENCVFVSVHMNSFPQSQYKGFQIYYSKKNPASRVLANEIQSAVKSELQPWNERKITEATSKIFLLDRLDCPAILIECGFLSNPEERRLLTTEIYQNQLSEIISEKIEKYVEKNLKTY